MAIHCICLPPKVALLLLLLLLTGCQTPWLATNGSAVVHRLASSLEIGAVALRDDLGESASARLGELPGLLDYAARRGLNVGHAYRRVDQVAGPASWIVAAADPATVTLHRWRFPIVGSVPYKGYRFQHHAIREQKNLVEAGWDADVFPVPAWSSLGWFPEPLPRSLLTLEEHRFATTIFHELVHRTVHISGDAELNEGLATFLGAQLAEQWLIGRHGEGSAVVMRHRSQQRDELRLNDLIRTLREQLTGGEVDGQLEQFRQLLATEPWEQFSGEELARGGWSLPRVLLARVYDPSSVPWDRIWQESAQDVQILVTWVRRHFSGTGADRGSLER